MNFEEMCKIDVSKYIEKKGELKYVSWTYAWSEFKKNYPDATYKIMFFNGLPYTYDDETGYMVFTEVTANGETQMMWLPVMDATNNAMKSVPYTIKTKYKETEVRPATMFDINKTIMRCLVKNIAMFGLGLYVYAGEDLPETEEEKEKKTEFKYQRPRCECGKEIEPIDRDDGTRMLVGDVVRFSQENYKGRILCKECMKKVSKGEAI